MKRAALYMGVSTKCHGQTTDTQALALREYAQRRGFEIMSEYRDEGISGSKDSRPALDRLMKDARARKFDVVIVARFDRFARSVSHLLRALEEFSQLGGDFVSLSESIDTSTPLVTHVFAGVGRRGRTRAECEQKARAYGHQSSAKRGQAVGPTKADIQSREGARDVADN